MLPTIQSRVENLEESVRNLQERLEELIKQIKENNMAYPEDSPCADCNETRSRASCQMCTVLRCERETNRIFSKKRDERFDKLLWEKIIDKVNAT